MNSHLTPKDGTLKHGALATRSSFQLELLSGVVCEATPCVESSSCLLVHMCGVWVMQVAQEEEPSEEGMDEDSTPTPDKAEPSQETTPDTSPEEAAAAATAAAATAAEGAPEAVPTDAPPAETGFASPSCPLITAAERSYDAVKVPHPLSPLT